MSPNAAVLHLFNVNLGVWRVTGILLLAFPAGAAAQEPLTLERAVAAALARNASVRAVQAAADEARARRAETASAWLPSVTVTESWQRGTQPVFVFSSLLSARRFAAANFAIDALNHPEATGFFQATLGIEQAVFDGGRRRAVADRAAASVDSASASGREVLQRVAVATTEAFGRLVAAHAARRSARAVLDAARQDHTRAISRRDAGMATEADVLSLAVHVSELELRVILADGEIASAEAELNRLMGLPVAAPVVFAEPDTSAIAEALREGDAASLFAEAERERPELARAAAAVRSAEAGRRQARSALVPNVVGQAAVNVSGTRLADRASSWIAGAELRWTWRTGGGDLAAVRASAAALARARADEDDARAAVHVEVRSTFHRLQAALARRTLSAAAVEQARESQRIIRNRYEAGLATVNDVLRASAAVLDADANRISALVDSVVTAALFQRALGRTP